MYVCTRVCGGVGNFGLTFVSFVSVCDGCLSSRRLPVIVPAMPRSNSLAQQPGSGCVFWEVGGRGNNDGKTLWGCTQEYKHLA